MSQNPQYNDRLIKEGMTGVVIKYAVEKKFGFIRSNDKSIQDDIFVYFNQIVPSQTNKTEKEHLKLHQYQEVTFDLYMSERGLVAKNVVRGKILEELLIQQVNYDKSRN